MYFRFIKNDILKSKLITFTTMIFIAAAAMLVSLAAILVVNLTDAMNTLMTKAKTPHFMQMHTGDLEMERLLEFAEAHPNVEAFQVMEFLNMDGAHIVLGDNSLASSVQDNGFSVQSEKFDYLLDLNCNIIQPHDGELYVPINYRKDNIAEVGDTAVVAGEEFTIMGYLRDSQMNSTLSTSKRFLVSKGDFERIRDNGNIEYLIEFRLKDPTTLSAFETDYASAGLEANGPVVTYPLFQMMNALSDGMMIAVILLVSLLVVAIALLCIRFTLLAKIDEDYREIGVMKAIGLRISDIKKIYIAKYALIAAVGSLVGFGLSFPLQPILLENIRTTMGESENAVYAVLLGVIGIILVFLAIMFYVNQVLRRFKKISAAEAIRFGTAQQTGSGTKRFTLNRNRLFPTNIFLGLKVVLGRKKLYMTMLIVLVISSFIILVPQNLYHTISSKSFIQYMGIGNYDIRFDVQQTEQISEKTAEIVKALENDEMITNVAVLTTKTFQEITADGTIENMKVELGDHSIFPIEYSEGRAPISNDEIALSAILADDKEKKLGDTITLLMDEGERTLTITGIYSDITNGGKTAKAVFTDTSADTMWSIISATVLDKAQIAKKESEYEKQYEFASIAGIDGFVSQTFGSTISAVEKAFIASVLVAVIITVLITMLFMKMLVARDRYGVAVMKAFGFTNKDVKAQFVTQSILILILGIILGSVLANTIGEMLVGGIISSFGATTFEFIVDPISAYIISPLLLAVAVIVATIIGSSDVDKIKISDHIKE